MGESKIKFAVTLYSLSCEYFTGKLDLEGCLKAVAEMGYKGIELVAAQMMPEYPNPSTEWMDSFKALLKKYDLEPVCYSAYIDMGIRTDRDMTEEEIFQCTLNDMMYASYMGFPIVRTQHAITPKIFETMVPYCKKFNIQLTIELHRPHTMHVPVWQEYMKVIDRCGKEYLGIVPDFSIFQRTPHKPFVDMSIRQGCRPQVLNTACEMLNKGQNVEDVLAVFPDASDFEKATVADTYSNFYSGSADVEDMRTLVKYAPYIHSKFYYLDEDKPDTCVPYDRLLPIIKECGYEGFLSSEYEGHHFTTEESSVVQLHRLIKMANSILENA